MTRSCLPRAAWTTRAVVTLLATALLLPAMPHANALAATAVKAKGPALTSTSGVLQAVRRKDVKISHKRAGSPDRVLVQDGTQAALVASPPPGAATSTWQVAYSGFDAASNPQGPQAQAAFQAAVDIWARIVTSSVPIRVAASFAALSGQTLGSAGSTYNYAGGGIGDNVSSYSSALSDALLGHDANPNATDITAQFTTNDSVSHFYYGTDGAPASGQVDFESVVLHELGHGLGFAGSMFVTNTNVGHYGSPPARFDRFTYDSPTTGNSLLSYPNDSTALRDVLTGQSVYWAGANAVTADGGFRPRMYAPATFEPGSTYSHFDEATYPLDNPNSLMTPQISAQEVIHSPGALAVAVFKDEGWTAALPAPSAPAAPTNVAATGHNASADVTWTAAVDNGSAVTGYTVTSSPDGLTCTTATTGCTVPGLTNGTSYTFTVTATNRVGTSPASSPSAAVVPSTTPGAPTTVTATAGDARAAVSWTVPNSTGGSTISSYTVTSAPGTLSCTTASTSCIVTGLTNGTSYTFTVTATNSAGTGAPSAPSNAVTPTASATAPGTPTGVTAVAGSASATVNWTAPASDGGSPVTKYILTANPPTERSCRTLGLRCTFHGLQAGTSYTFTVAAVNAVGTGPSSPPSSPVVPTPGPTSPAGFGPAPVSPVTVGRHPQSTAFSPSGHLLAVSNQDDNNVSVFAVTPGGVLTPVAGSPFATQTAPVYLDFSPDGNFLAVGRNGVGVSMFSVAADGVLSPVAGSPFNIISTGIHFSPNSHLLASVNPGYAGTVNMFTVSSAGVLTEVAGSPYRTPREPQGVAFNPAGTLLAVTVFDDHQVVVYSVGGPGPGEGTLTEVAGSPFTLPGIYASGVTFNADGTLLAAAMSNSGYGLVSVFSVSTGGFLTEVPASPFASLGAIDVGFSPVGGLLNVRGFGQISILKVGAGGDTADLTDAPYKTPCPTVLCNSLGYTAFSPNGALLAIPNYTAGDVILLVQKPTAAISSPASGGSYTTGQVVATAFSCTDSAAGSGISSCVDNNGGSGTSGTLDTSTAGSHTYTVTATSNDGFTGTTSISYTVADAAPGAPTGVSAVRGNQQATVSFTAPSSNGSPISGYTVTSSPGGFTGTGSTSPITVTGLTNGTAYTFTVTATNGVGTGAPSAASNSVTPAAVPGAPTSVSAVRGNQQATVTFTAPASNGSAITSYTVTAAATGNASIRTGSSSFVASGGGPASGPSSPIIVTGLTNGTAYTFTVAATNGVGTGPASSPSNAVTPAGLPGAPTGVSATRGDTQAAVSFTAPSSNGSPISSYTVTSSPGSFTGTGATSPITVTGLTNGTAYTFTVTATNGVGTGAASGSSTAVTPAGLPGTPTGVTATRGDTQAFVSWVAPSPNGSALTGFVITPSSGSPVTVTDPAATGIAVTGLTNGTAYTFTVAATNSVGTGTPSAASNSVTPAGAPGAPTSVAATRGDTQATVSFTAPSSNGSPISSYTVASSPGGFTGTGTTSPITITGLTNGTAYTFTVTATNDVGTGAPSAASNSVTPAAVPGAPTAVTAARGDTQATVSFTAPPSNGSPISSYTVTSAPGNFTGTGTGSPIAVTGLTNGTAYTFSLTATNDVGTGAASSASNSVTPAGVPGAPTSVSADRGNTQATVSFTAPASNGSPITNYTVTSSPGSFTGMGTSSPITVTGLSNGTAYTFTVTATNDVGTGAASGPSSGTTPAAAPGAPTGISATPGDSQAGVSFTAPSDNGSPISSYTVTSVPGGLTGTGSTSPITVTGLTNGTAYTFTVTATNGVGTGAASGSSTAVTPAGLPGTPTGVTATRGDSQAFVSWVAPNPNGSALTGFLVTPSSGSPVTVTDPAATGIAVTGLTNGTAYTFTVAATNDVGTGTPSAPSNSVTPAGAPGAPTSVSAVRGDHQATVTFTAPANNSSAITGYTVTSSQGSLTATGTGSPITITGLTNGTAYTFTITATNDVGTGTPSAPSNSVTPAGAPGAPTSVSATRGDSQATVSFIAPASNGSAITGYTVTSSQGNLTATGTGSPITITGLTNGTAYTITVTASNGVGAGPASSPSAAVTPAGVPGTPTSVSAVPGDHQATVSFNAPSNNGSAITGYTVTSAPGGITGTGTGSPITVTGLTTGTAYTFTITATNDVGTGTASAPSNSVSPVGAPGAPTGVSATAGDSQATVGFTAPSSNGSPISSYIVTSSPGGITATGTGSPITVAGLSNGTAYTFTVKATNAVGAGAASSPSTAVTPAGLPGTPNGVTASAGDTQAFVSWVAPNANGSALTGFVVTPSSGSPVTVNDPAATGVSVTGLTNGTAYTFTVAATNSVGTGTPSAPSNAITPTSTDTTAPTATITFGPPAVTRSTEATFNFTGDDPGRPSATLTFQCSLDGTAFSTCASPASSSGLSNGTHAFRVRAQDEVGNVGSPVTRDWVIDTVTPTVSVSALPTFSTGRTVGLRYAGDDGSGSGVVNYDVRYRRAPWNAGFGSLAYPAIGQATAARGVTVRVSPGQTYCFAVRSRDAAGNVSAWSAEQCTASALDDISLKPSAGWTRISGAGYYFGAVTTGTRAGLTLTRTTVQTRRIAILATRCPKCGTLGVYWNGRLLKTVSLAARTTGLQQVLLVTDLGTVRTGTLVLKTINAGRVYVDGVALSRS